MPLPIVFRHPAFATLWCWRLLSNIGAFMQSTTIGWVVYVVARQTQDQEHSMFLVGMVGLAQFLPMFALVLVAGAVADKFDRRKILFACGVLYTFCALSFTLLSLREHASLPLIFIVAALFGVARTFSGPAGTSLVPMLVPREVMPKAIAWNTLTVQGGLIAGPWLGGLLCAVAPVLANGTASVLYLCANIASLILLRMKLDTKPQQKRDAARLVMIREGLAHLWDSKIVLGAISLDLFAVLLGGVTALLPAYARDILMIGPDGFGELRSVFALGAGGMTLILAAYPIKRRAGVWMLGGVMAYGVATLGFALSRNVDLSLLLLAMAGAADSVSVFVRQNLVQIVTPDAMRGRVSAVSGLFISASNELGEFESGLAARFMGVVGSAVFGGLGSILVVGLWARLFPALRKADHLVPPTAL